ncbi:hypothetical protein OIU84_027433 [Salix udensis]|uniref:Protein kinase domain-containing protein n=1 Tax=Salix udensis TaxID=889485 RepID=A0AAD6KFI0_9ROSI|nr:hypothetical protein OIU84_027433 [Salix udensis]
MNCFSCFQSQKSRRENGSPAVSEIKKQRPGDGNKMVENKDVEIGDIETQSFTFRELAAATRNFRQECLLGEGGFGRVYRGTLASTGQVVAVKQLDRNGLQRNEFLGEVLTLSRLHHPNLVNLIGYCADGDQRLLVHELMSGGSLEDHLLDKPAERKPLNWFARMKITFGTAKGLEFLHEKADPPAQPKFKDPKKYPDMADPLLNKQFPEKDLNQVVAIAAMCLQEESSARPLMSDVVTALSFLSTDTDHMPQLIQPSEEKDGSDEDDKSSDGCRSEESSDDEDRANEHDGDTSDHRYDESSDNEDGDSDSRDHQTVTGSKNFTASSSMKSMDESTVSSARKNSRRLEEFTSNGRGSQYGSVSSYGASSRSSHCNASLRHKSSNKSKNSSSHKSSTGSKLEGSPVSTSGKSSSSSSRRTRERNASSSFSSSQDLEDETGSVKSQ